MSFGAIRPKWRASNEIGVKKFLIFFWTPLAHRKVLSESYTRTQFHAKNAKNDLNPTYLVKSNFWYETEGVVLKSFVPIVVPQPWMPT